MLGLEAWPRLEAEKPDLDLVGCGLGLVGFGLEPLEAYSRNGM